MYRAKVRAMISFQSGSFSTGRSLYRKDFDLVESSTTVFLHSYYQFR